MIDLTNIATEQVNDRTKNLDILSIRDSLYTMNEEDQGVSWAIKKEIPQIEKVIKGVIKSFNKGGRLIYMGAGTSGRLGMLDAAECPPTFGTEPEMVKGLIAGGEKAFVKAIEGAEDSSEIGKNDLQDIKLTSDDIVIGLAASGRTPYVIGGINYAKEIGAKTVALACNKNSK